MVGEEIIFSNVIGLGDGGDVECCHGPGGEVEGGGCSVKDVVGSRAVSHYRAKVSRGMANAEDVAWAGGCIIWGCGVPRVLAWGERSGGAVDGSLIEFCSQGCSGRAEDEKRTR